MAFADAPDVHLVERIVIHPPDDGHGPHASVTRDGSERPAARGELVVEWAVHGLRYGVPASALDAFRSGKLVVPNGSRGALPRVAVVFPRREVCRVTVSRHILERRLRARGRESEAAIERRLARKIDPTLFGDPVWKLDTEGPFADAAARFVSKLEPLRRRDRAGGVAERLRGACGRAQNRTRAPASTARRSSGSATGAPSTLTSLTA